MFSSSLPVLLVMLAVFAQADNFLEPPPGGPMYKEENGRVPPPVAPLPERIPPRYPPYVYPLLAAIIISILAGIIVLARMRRLRHPPPRSFKH